jgi:heme/copper-type cytochrome/quinol oxidase subunit 4
MAHDQHTHQQTDAKAAFMGLIFGVIALFIIVRAIVWWTNGRFEGHKTQVESTK